MQYSLGSRAQGSAVRRSSVRHCIAASTRLKGLPVCPCIPAAKPSKRGSRALKTCAYGGGGISPWEDLDRQFAQMEQQMDRDFADIFGRTSRTLELQRQQLERQQEELLQQAQRQQLQPNVQVQRFEQRGQGSYTYYQSIEISSGGSYRYPVAAPATPPAAAGFNPLLLLGLLGGAYAAVAVAFAQAFDRTTYQSRWRWALVPLWPVLAVFSPSFRRQLTAVLQGKRAPVMKEEGSKPEGTTAERAP